MKLKNVEDNYDLSPAHEGGEAVADGVKFKIRS
jgi:hypothetical protein